MLPKRTLLLGIGKDQVIYFTSGTDAANEDQWKWASTEQGIGFTDWYPGDPDGALGQNCLVLWGKANFEWIDASCEMTYNSICKIRIPINDTAILG
ncbi:Perlucin-like protein [Mizuhopecten yessoensis]|uniref:Perlucin-like protein n=1 Tax=Mizuhopecten yessoensis TaxID=6573 RepID=A0A210PGR9_MIZYE|nr:Perlucin-like protein [Mizuhopecten yessoensis]